MSAFLAVAVGWGPTAACILLGPPTVGECIGRQSARALVAGCLPPVVLAAAASRFLSWLCVVFPAVAAGVPPVWPQEVSAAVVEVASGSPVASSAAVGVVPAAVGPPGGAVGK